MNKLSLSLLSLILISCSGQISDKKTSCKKYASATSNQSYNRAKVLLCQGKKKSALGPLQKACLFEFKNSCSILGYTAAKQKEYTIAKKAYGMACMQGDESACFNLKNLPNEQNIYLKKAYAALKRNSGRVSACYAASEGQEKMKSTMQQDRRMQLIRYEVRVNPKGKMSDLKVESNLGERMKECMWDVMSNVHFPIPPANFVPVLRQTVTLHVEGS